MQYASPHKKYHRSNQQNLFPKRISILFFPYFIMMPDCRCRPTPPPQRPSDDEVESESSANKTCCNFRKA
jgi:hypothetical protein